LILDHEEQKAVKKAEALIDIGRPREAVTILTKFLLGNSQNFHATCLLARCFYELNENGEALKYAEKAIQIEPENEWAHRLRSIALGELGKNKESLKSAREAARLAPDEPNALENLANALLQNGKPEEAKLIAEKSLEIAPDSESAHFTAGNVFLNLRYYHLAEKHFLEALRINPASANARNNLGIVALRRDGKPENAAEHFAQAVKLEPTNTLAIENLRLQFSVLPQIAVLVALLPLAVFGILIMPGFTLIFLVISLWVVIKTFFVNIKNRHQLAAEFRILFNSETYQNRFKRSVNVFADLSKNVFLQIRLAYVFAAVACVLRLVSFHYNSDLLKVAAYLIFLACPFIIYKKFSE
jgi:tetratricopeptide (TPR) repeat protein